MPSVTCRQHSVLLGDFPLNFANFPCGHETFHECLPIFHATTKPYITFLCSRRNLRPLPLAIRVVKIYSVNFRQCSMRPADFSQLPSTFHVAGRPFVNFRQLSVHAGDFPSTTTKVFLYSGGLQSTSVNFLCSQSSFVNFRQLSARPGDLPSTSINILCGRRLSVEGPWPHGKLMKIQRR